MDSVESVQHTTYKYANTFSKYKTSKTRTICTFPLVFLLTKKFTLGIPIITFGELLKLQ
jgi:hypothetical protein